MKAITKPYSVVFIFGIRDEEDKKYFERNKKDNVEWNERMFNILNNLRCTILDIERYPEYMRNWKLNHSIVTNESGDIIQIALYVSNKTRGIYSEEEQTFRRFARRGVRYYDIWSVYSKPDGYKKCRDR